MKCINTFFFNVSLDYEVDKQCFAICLFLKKW